MVRINKEDYRRMTAAMKARDVSGLRNLNLAPGTDEAALLDALRKNASAGLSLEETFGPFELVDGQTELISQEEIEALLNN